MKGFFKQIVLWLLKLMAKKRLKKFSGKIIAVTGSVGKTSTREAIFSILNSKYRVKQSQKSMNTDFGVLLTILDIDSGYSSLRKWSWLLTKAFFHSFFKDHSEILLLELGVDAPGDMDTLTSIVKPDIAVMTNVFPVHLAEGQFKNLQEIFAEKKKLVDALKDDGIAILNTDNTFLAYLAKERGQKGTITFGKNEEADYFSKSVKMTIEGMTFIMHHGDKRYEVKANVLGEYHVYVLLPAIACAKFLGISLEEAIIALDRYVLPPGRMNIIPAKKEAIVLDSSYNSSPEALNEALKVLKEIGVGRRKVAVLGNMNELGEETAILHQMIGEAIPEYVDLLITIGGDAKLMAIKAEEKGMEKKAVHAFKTTTEAIDFFEKELKKDDIILVKGSQNKVRLERFVKAFMAHPEDAKDLLVRQGKVWRAKL